MSVRPKIIDSFHKMFEHLKKQGLFETDIVYLLQKRTSPRVSIKDIKATLNAIQSFEKQIDKASKKNE